MTKIVELTDALSKQRTLKGVIARESTLQRYITSCGGTPVTDGDTAHFFFEHDEKIDIWVVGDWNNWKRGVDKMERINPKSTLYHLAKHFARDARMSYRFIVGNDESTNDPENPRTHQEVFGNNTYFTMPDYRGTTYLDEPSDEVNRGEIRELEVHSARGLAFGRKVFVYLPEKPKRGRKYYFLYVHDGEEAIRIGKFANVLDNMRHFEPELPKVIVVFIPPVDRHAEYLLNAKFARWCATSLVKQAERSLGVKCDATMRGMLGASLGGLCAAYTGLLFAKIFGNIACQSPSFWVNDREIIKEASAERRKPVRFFLHTGRIHDALAETRAMRDVLEAKGYDVSYLETNESHNWANWSTRYEEVVKWLVGE